MGLFLHTMKIVLVLACLALASAKHVHVKIDQLEYGFCDGSAEPASIDNASVEPFPIVVATDETITLSVHRLVSRSRKKDLSQFPSLALRLKDFILDHVTMTGTICSSLVLRPSALTTSLMVRSASSPSTLVCMEEESPWYLVPCLRYPASSETSWPLELTTLTPPSLWLMEHRWRACMLGWSLLGIK